MDCLNMFSAKERRGSQFGHKNVCIVHRSAHPARNTVPPRRGHSTTGTSTHILNLLLTL